MKSLIAALLIVSTSAFAGEAMDTFRALVPAGTYNGNGCSVSVSDLGNKIVITASNSMLTTKREISENSSFFRPNRNPNNFYSSDMVTTRRGLTENFVRTVIASDSTRYFAVGSIFQADYPNGDRENVVECVVNL